MTNRSRGYRSLPGLLAALLLLLLPAAGSQVPISTSCACSNRKI